MAFAREDAHVGTDLGEDHLSGVASHPRDALEQEGLTLERGRGGPDALGQGRDVGLEVVDVGQHAFEQEGMVLAETARQRLAKSGELGAQLAPGELGQTPRDRPPRR